MSKILITGIAGFIGSTLAHKLRAEGHDVCGLDSFNDYYDTRLKYARANLLDTSFEPRVPVHTCNLLDIRRLDRLFDLVKPDVVIHLAAYAGVRHSFDNQQLYIDNNITGTQNLIEVCERYGVENVIYASTSCTMAGCPLPWKEDQPLNMQLNPYGYTKRTNECQFNMSKIKNTIGLRFFTVYGPWGRPDMALFTFTRKILAGEPIDVFNNGNMIRDFTYVDDIVNGLNIMVNHINSVDNAREVYNIGNGRQVNLMDFIAEIEKNLGIVAIKNYLPKHPADTIETWSDTTKIQALGYTANTPIEQGVAEFIKWYRSYYGV